MVYRASRLVASWPLLLTLILLVGCASSATPFTPATPRYVRPVAGADGRLAFPDAVTLRNRHVEIAVSPSVGRIVRFSRIGQDNLLWIAGGDAYDHPFVANGRSYVNLGGDKVWPTVQSLWPRAYGGGEWPPEAAIDGQPWTLVEHTARRVTIESAVSPSLGVRVRRTVSLAKDAPRVEITSIVTRVRASVFPVHVWSITQTVPPAAVILGIASDRVTTAPWVHLSDPAAVVPHLTLLGDERAVLWRVDQQGDAKLGTLGSWAAGVYNDTLFLQSARFDSRAAYPDASSVQVYSSGDYAELELLSGLTHLQPGETLTHRVTWQLLDRPADASPEQLHQLLERAAGQ